MTSPDDAVEPEVEPEVIPPPHQVVPQVPGAVIKRGPDGWHLIQHGTWEVSVAPDGMVMLPRHVHPDEETEFLTAMSSACALGRSIREGNMELARRDDRTPTSRLMVTEGGLPPGAVRMPLVTGPNSPASRASIGRVNPRVRRQPGPQPAGTQGQSRPRVPAPPRMPNQAQ